MEFLTEHLFSEKSCEKSVSGDGRKCVRHKKIGVEESAKILMHQYPLVTVETSFL